MADIKYYDVILKPVVTEKSMNAQAERKYTFYVAPEANKTMIKEAVENKNPFHEPDRKEPQERVYRGPDRCKEKSDR